jgi:arabinofuranosyltransferase
VSGLSERLQGWLVWTGLVVASWALLGCGRAAPDSLLAGKTPEVMTFAMHGERLTDGVRGKSGAPWNSSLSARLQLGGSVEWDLGREARIARVWLQADNDDSYAVLASTDRDHWSTVWEAAAVPEPGLQARSAELLLDATARFVRLEPRGGDGNYAVSELVLSSSRHGPWPPRLSEASGKVEADPALPALGRPLSTSALVATLALLAALGWRERRPAPLRRGPLLWITLGLALFMVLTALDYARIHRFNLVDDAYISLQYAKNWIAGDGLVFNPGERVEGYTNFLWVALVAPLWPLTGHDPALVARAVTWLALGLAVLGLGLVALIARRTFGAASLPAALALLLLGFDDAYLSYPVVFGLENQLLVVLVLTGLALTIHRPRYWELGLGTSFALVGMTRPDGLLWVGAFFIVYGVSALRARPTSREGVSLRSLVGIGASFALLFGAYFACRYWYFGELLPNTFYLKVGDTLAALQRGLNYVKSYAMERAGVPVVALTAVFFTRATWVRWIAAHTALHTAYVVYVGGDFYSGHRFLMVLTPGLALLAGVALQRALAASERESVEWLSALAALLACLGVRWGTLRHGPYTVDLFRNGIVADNNVKYMQWLKKVARPGSSMVVGDIGATGFFADVRVLDVFGVVDRAVAHKRVASFGTGMAGHEKRMTREEQLAGSPRYIKWGYVDDSRPPPGYYIFNDFPLELHVEGLWVRDDAPAGRPLTETAWHFNAGEMKDWERTGSAFSAAPTRGHARGQGWVNGQQGQFIDTFTDEEGDEATGSLLSPPFALVGDRMRLLIGGGRDPERLRVSLLVGGRLVASATGSNWETLGRREWDISPWRGQTARVEIIDRAKGAWGHLLVDEIEQWQGAVESKPRL